jgi:hypothetical protein
MPGTFVTVRAPDSRLQNYTLRNRAASRQDQLPTPKVIVPERIDPHFALRRLRRLCLGAR